MRLCLYTETAVPKIGGQEMVVDALAREFTAAGHDVTVLTQFPRRPIQPADELLPYRMVRHRRFVSTWRWVGWYRRSLERLRARFPFDLLHCHSVHPCGYVGSLGARKWNVPLVITSHGADLRQHRLSKPAVAQRSRQTLAAADALISISRFTTEGFLQLCRQPRRLVEIPNGVDIAALERPVARPELPDSIRAGEYLLFLGRLHPFKGVDVLLQAMVLLSQRSDARLVVAGDGPQREGLEMLAVSLGIAPRVTFLGAVAGDTRTWLLQNARVVVAPSRAEAAPLVVLEAQGASRPVVASRLPALEGLIVPDQTGLLVDPEQPAALADALVHVVANPQLADRLGAAGREAASQYAWPAIAARHLALFEQVVAGKQGAQAA